MKILTWMTLVALLAALVKADTIAFYPFCDAADGESAVTVATNAAVAGTMPCGIVGKGSDPRVVFSSDAPGKYLYASGTAGAELLVCALQSVDFGQGEAGVSSAELLIPDAPQALASCNDTGYTVEYFFRLPPEAPLPGYSASLLYDCGYEYDGVTYPFCVYLACADGFVIRYGLNSYDPTGAKGGFCGKITLGAAIDARLKYALNDGKWHHFAVVETVSASTVAVNLYIDRILVKTHALPAGVTRSSVFTDNEPEFKLVRGVMSGNLSGLRLSSRALAPTEFLVASERAPGNFGDDVIGFYPFDDKEDGASAVGRTVFNAAQPMVAPCTVTTNSGNSVAEFSSESPAKYIFVGERYGEKPYYVNPGSVYLTSPQNGDSGSLIFERMATELSKCHESGHTVEWFFRLTDDGIAPMVASYSCNAGYLNGAVEKQCSLFLPFAMNYSDGRQFRFSLGNYSEGRCLTKELDYRPTDGLWHHIAVVGDGAKLKIFIDYVSYGEVTVDGTRETVAERSLELVRNVLHGKFSCVKVKKRALGAGEFLRASNIETYWPKTLTMATFDGQIGSGIPSTLENSAISFAAANETVYAAQDCTGNFSLRNQEEGNPSYSGERICRRPQVFGEGGKRGNLASGYTLAADAGDSAFRPAPHFRMPVSAGHDLPCDFTVEGFFRFDKASWSETAGEYAKLRDRLCLMTRKLSSGYSWKLSFVDALSQKTHRLFLYSYHGQGTGDYSFGESLPVFNDDTWHHIAVTHDSARNRMVVYCDYRPVITNDIGSALHSPSSGYLAIGDGRSVNDNDFHGWVDEVRCSSVCLESEEFLRQSSIPVGMSITVR